MTYTLAENGNNQQIPTFTLRTPTNFTDYEQIGWTEDETKVVAEVNYVANQEIDLDHSINLYGLYQRNLTVSYEKNTGDTVPSSHSQVQTYHSYLGQTEHEFTLLGNATKLGYTFTNWAQDSVSGTKYNVSDKVKNEEHKKYYALWRPNVYNIKYNYNNGTKGSSNPATGTYDEEVNISNPTKTITITGNANGDDPTIGSNTTQKLTFSGWTFDGDVSTALHGTSGNVTTKWSDASTQVTSSYFKNLTPTDTATINMTANWSGTTMKVPTISKTGYTCNWNTKADGTGTSYGSAATYTPSYNGSTSITLYAQCSPNNYTVVYNGNNNTGGSTASSSHTYDSAKNLTKNGFTKAYTVTYNANGGSVSPASATAACTFGGWATSSTGEATYSDQQSVINLTTTANGKYNLYATWSGGKLSSLPTPTRDGYTFDGWYTAASGGTKVTTSTELSSDTTLYAHWKANNYTVTFIAEGVSLTTNTKTVTYDQTYGTLPTVSKTGYTFTGWYDAYGNKVTETTKVNITSDSTLTAGFKINSYTFNTTIGSNNYGTITSTPGTYDYNTSITVKATPKVGYVFAGWYDGTSMLSYNSTYTFNMPAKNLTIEAKFSFDISSISNVKVLNVYPQLGDNLKGWMETNGYGVGKMSVTSVTQDAFGANPQAYLGTSGNWKYDIVVFGFWDANNNTDISAAGSALIEQYILEKNPVLFGHDTIANVIYENGVVSSSMLQHPNYAKLAKYVNVSLSDGFYIELSPTVTIQKESLFTSYPHQIGGVGTKLTIPQTHVLGQTVLDPNNIFLTFDGIGLTGGENFYLTVYENCAFIQTGHTSGAATDDEQKILANIIFYLYAQSIMSKE